LWNFGQWAARHHPRPMSTVAANRGCSVGARSAPRGAWLYPRRSREELGGRFLGPMAYLDPKGEGNSSMPGKQRSCSGVWNEALRGPRDMANSWIA
jgi:hypothetical protein